MVIAGYKQATLIDFPGKLSAVVFIYGCNLRCRFCHNPELVIGTPPPDKTDDLFKDIEKHSIKSVAITGGEPLFADGFLDFLKKLKDMGLSVKLDTNGSLPERLRYSISKGLVDYVAMDMKGFSDDELFYITRKPFKLQTFMESLNILTDSNIPYEIRFTLWKKLSERDIDTLKTIHRTAKVIYIQRMVKSGRILDKRFQPLSEAEFKEEKTRIESKITGIKFRDYSIST